MSQHPEPTTIGRLPWKNTIARHQLIRPPPLRLSIPILISPSRPWTTWTSMRPPSSRRCCPSRRRPRSRWSCSWPRKSLAPGKRSSTPWTTCCTWTSRRPCRTRPRSTRSSRCWSSPRRSSNVTASSCASARTAWTARTWYARSPSSDSNRSAPSPRWRRRTSRSSRRASTSSWSTASRNKEQTQTKARGCVSSIKIKSPASSLAHTHTHIQTRFRTAPGRHLNRLATSNQTRGARNKGTGEVRGHWPE